MAGLASLSIQQQLDVLQKLSSQSPTAKQAYLLAKKNPSQTTQLFTQLIAINNAQIQKQKEAETASNTLSQQQAQQVQITQSKLLHHQQTPAQRIQAARQAFRAQADKQLMTIPTQKAQTHDLTFLPNPNASAFHALLGLDLVVQYVQKDKSVDKWVDISLLRFTFELSDSTPGLHMSVRSAKRTVLILGKPLAALKTTSTSTVKTAWDPRKSARTRLIRPVCWKELSRRSVCKRR